jgi:predicted phosphodiesterase
MRIVQLTDLHVNKKRFHNDNRLPLNELLLDLKEWNNRKKIDCIVITGDIVDKGGISFNKKDYYDQIENRILKPIYEGLQLSKQQVLMIPGNHDINRGKVDNDTHLGLMSRLNKATLINEHISQFRASYKPGLKGCEVFNNFQKSRIAKSRKHYISNFESAFIFPYGGENIGFAAFNSSWSCFNESDESTILFGTQQILNASDFFNKAVHKTSFNIGLIHHPFDVMLKEEVEQAEMFLKKEGFSFILCGHTHRDATSKIQKRGSEMLISVTRSAFNNNSEKNEDFKSGYKIIDFTYSKEDFIDIVINYRKYAKTGYFDYDTDHGEKGGAETFRLSVNERNKRFYNLLKEKNKELSAERKKIFEELSQKTRMMLDSSYPNISDRILETINNNILFFKEFEHYRQNMTVEYEIRMLGKNYFEIHETQTYDIISTGKKFNFIINAYVEIENEQDKSDIHIDLLEIDGKDYSKKVKYANERAVTGKKDRAGAAVCRKITRLNIMLPGKTFYTVKRLQTSTHTLKRNGIWKADVGEIMDGIKVIIKNNGDFKIDLIEFGNNPKFAKNLSGIGGIKKGTKTEAEYKGILMPGDGYMLIVNKA